MTIADLAGEVSKPKGARDFELDNRVLCVVVRGETYYVNGVMLTVHPKTGEPIAVLDIEP